MSSKARPTWTEFSEATTLHGFRFLFSGAWFRRGIWFIILTGAMAFLSYELYFSVLKYQSHPISTRVVETYPLEIPFPSVSICVRSPLALQKIRNNIFLKELAASKGWSTDSSTWGPPIIIRLLQETERLGKYGELLLNATSSTAWLIQKASFNKRTIPRSDFLISLKDTNGLCYTFNEDYEDQITVTKNSDGTFEIIYKLPVKNDLLPNLKRGNSLFVILKEPGEYTNLDKGIHVPAGFAAYIGIKRKEISLLPPPTPKSHCTADKKLAYFKRYSGLGCMDECYHNMTMAVCNCSSLLFQRGLASDCNSTVNCYDGNVLESCTKHCKEGCESASYTQSVSYRHFAGESDADPDWLKASGFGYLTPGANAAENYQLLRKSYVFLKVYYEDFGVTNISEIEVYDLISFLADLGGQLGLFIGASVITWFEFVDFVLRWIWALVCKRERNVSNKSDDSNTSEPKSILKNNDTVIDIYAPANRGGAVF